MIWFYDLFCGLYHFPDLLADQGWRDQNHPAPGAGRLAHRAYLAFLVAIVLLMTRLIPLHWLYRPLWPQGLLAFWLGAVITVSGLLFAVWARDHLGRNWSRSVTIKQDHELITSGPYAVVRHPIYTGILVGFLGSAIAMAEVRGFVVLVLIFLVFWAKLRMEEKWMHAEFGETYDSYVRRSAALVPYLF